MSGMYLCGGDSCLAWSRSDVNDRLPVMVDGEGQHYCLDMPH